MMAWCAAGCDLIMRLDEEFGVRRRDTIHRALHKLGSRI